METKKEINYEKLIDGYIRIRDSIDEAKKKFEESIKPKKEILQEIESLLCGDLEEKGLKSFSTGKGTVYKEKWVKTNLVDWDSFISYVSREKRYDLLEKRVAKLNTLDIIDQGGSVPGVEVESGYSVKIRRK